MPFNLVIGEAKATAEVASGQKPGQTPSQPAEDDDDDDDDDE